MSKSYYKDVTAILKQHNCYFDRQASGSHEMWFSPVSQLKFTIPSNLKSKHTANAILKQAGLEKSF